MRSTATRLLILSLFAALGACANDEDPVDLGRDDPRALGSALSDYAGSWDGYAEAYEFSDGTDSVQLAIGTDGTGELRVGEAPELPPPDPARGYPDSAGLKQLGPRGAVPGFAYPFTDATVDDNRIRMHSAMAELYREWCGLMTPHVVRNATPEYYACLPYSGYDIDGNGNCTTGETNEDPIDCGLLDCLSVCECNGSECSATGTATSDIRIDATLEGDPDSFVGTLVLGSERITVRLTRN
jgi:hypothetical protein